MNQTFAIVLIFCVLLPVCAFANDDAPHFETHVRAIFKTHCFHCHGEEESVAGDLDLRLVRSMLAGGSAGAAIVPGAADESLLYQRVRDAEMPPDESKRLSDDDVAAIGNWIAAGAKTIRPEPDSIDDVDYFTQEERSHWSFQPIVRPEVPTVQSVDLVNNPIDAFLLSRLESAGFQYSARADVRTLVRRLVFDLHGLPPTTEQVDSLGRSDNPAGWRRLIDELLNSHLYGQRWARHWLDVAGYADSEGYNDVDAERPDAWRYRDYVIDALNNDLPFDEFIRQQLAGDELISSPLTNLSGEDVRLLTATGFLRMAPDGTGGAVPDAKVARNDTIADTIKIVSSSLMGMTVGCAQCHDHRYDPISHEDYYRFRAIFEPAFDWQRWRNPVQRRVSLYTDEDRAAEAKVEEKAKAMDADRLAKQTEFIDATFEKQLAELPPAIHQLARSAHKTDAKKRTAEQSALLKKHPNLNVTAGSLYLYDRKAADELKAMAAEVKKVRDTKPPKHYVRALTEIPGQVPVTYRFARGDHEQPKQELKPGGLSVISSTAALNPIPENVSNLPTTGRRLALAQQLTDRNHPLTARVLVNRIWMHHFGRGLVPTPSDFGVLGQPPSHPLLLDWLASEFVESGWSLKHMHRLILSSNAWQQQLATDPKLLASDPDNELYGGARLTRLDAEVLRDAILQIAGRLNLKSSGPPVPVMADQVGRFVIGKENLNAGRPGPALDMDGEDLRRSIYVQVRRSRPLSVLDVFDQPLMTPNCDRRRPATNSPQSLLMLNSDLLIRDSRWVADRIVRETGDDVDARVVRAWQLVYARTPSDQERIAATEFIAEQTDTFLQQNAYKPNAKNPPAVSAADEALALTCQMLLSSNEFLYID